MSAWIVYSKDGKTQRCELKRLEYSGSHMGERAVTATFEHHSEVAFDVFDYILYRGEKFELESVPSVKKVSRNEYEYELRFVSLKYELERCEMRDIVPNDNGVVYPTPLTFSFTGDVRYLADRIQANLDALYGKGVWSIVVANGVSSDEKNISIAQQNCWNALSLVNTTYGLNFSVRGREVVIGGEIDAVSHTFQYGKGNGLYEIERVSDTDTGIVTKLRAYGSTKNLDYSYPKKPEWADSVLPVSFALSPLRLMLPSFKEDGKTDFVLADDAVIAKYGIREASIVYDDIYPSIAGAKNSSGQAIDEIASVDAVNEESSTFTVYLHDLGFDLEEHLTTAEAQLSMKTGTLQGYTFNISAIDRQGNGGYKLTLGRNSVEGSEESGFNVPNEDWNMKAGDKFVLLNILMPQSYIREAEARLLVRAKEYLAEYGKTNFSYNVGLHDKFLVEHPSVYDSLIEGVKLRVQDNELGISEDVIIQSITITEYSDDNILPQVKVTLNNKPSASTLDRIQGKLNDVIAETSANNFSSQSELMAQYRKKLDKPFFDKLFVAIDKDGNEIASNDVATPVSYIKAKYSIATVGGVTMYAEDDVEVPTLAEGLPFDQRTIWFNPETKQIEVIGGTGGGGEGGVSNFWDLSGIPSWITSTKPTYSYSEILGTPDLNGYATISALNAVSTKLNDFLEGSDTDTVINKWKELEAFLSGLTESDNLATILTGKADKSYVDTNFVTIAGTEDVTGLHNFVNGLKIGGIELVKKQDDVVYLDGNLVVKGGITMYGDGEGGSSIPSYSTLGSLLNVDESNDAVASVDRVLFQSAGSNVWSWKALSEIGGGSSGGSVSGNYLPLSGGTLTGNLVFGTDSAGISFTKNGSAYGALRLSDDNEPSWMYSKTWTWETIIHSGNYSSYALPLSGGTLTGKLTIGLASAVPLVLQNTSATNSYIDFKANGWSTTKTGGVGIIREPYLGNEVTLLTCGDPRILVSEKGGIYYQEGYNTETFPILHSGNISSYNAGSATKLQTARTIWGQSFDGTADITTGDITAYASSDDTTSLNLFKARGDVGWQLSGRYGNDLGLKIYYYDKSSWNNYLRIYTNGNVEVYQSLTIGSPYIGNGNFRVGGRSYFGDWVYLFDNSSNTANNDSSRLYFAASGYDKGVFLQGINVATYGRKRLGVFVNNEASYNATAWNEALSVLPDGKVGIGTTSPSTKLHVNGGLTCNNIIVDMESDKNASVNLRGTTTDLWQISARYGADKGTLKFYYYNGSTWAQTAAVTSAGNVTVLGGITMYSDQRKKTILNHVELSLKQIADAPLIEHYYNSDQDKTTHVGSIAQYWAGLNDWFCKLDNEGFYTMEIQNCALASAISIARHLEKYESKTDKKIRMLKKRVQELEYEVERLKQN